MVEDLEKRLRLLFIEPSEAVLSELIDCLNSAQVAADISECTKPAQAASEFSSGEFDACILGPGIGLEKRLLLLKELREAASAAAVPACKFIAVTPNATEENFLVSAGADAVLEHPPLAATLRSAFFGLAPAEEPAPSSLNLPSLLERYAAQLEAIAERLRAAESQGIRLESSPKVIKEILLTAVALGSKDDTKEMERLVQGLLRAHPAKQQRG